MKEVTRTIWDDAINEYRDYGFNIDITDAFLLKLFFKDKEIATFYRNMVTPGELQSTCETYLKSIAGEPN